MAALKRFEEIQAWQQARKLVGQVYSMTAEGKLKNDFGLRNQLCRAAVSSMSNVAEGFTRKSDKDFSHFLDIARASAIEVQSLLYVASDVGYIAADDFRRLFNTAEETAALIGGFTSYLRGNSRTRTPDGETPDPGRRDSGLRTPD